MEDGTTIIVPVANWESTGEESSSFDYPDRGDFVRPVGIKQQSQASDSLDSSESINIPRGDSVPVVKQEPKPIDMKTMDKKMVAGNMFTLKT